MKRLLGFLSANKHIGDVEGCLPFCAGLGGLQDAQRSLLQEELDCDAPHTRHSAVRQGTGPLLTRPQRFSALLTIISDMCQAANKQEQLCTIIFYIPPCCCAPLCFLRISSGRTSECRLHAYPKILQVNECFS